MRKRQIEKEKKGKQSILDKKQKAWRKTVTERCSIVIHPGHRVVYKTRTLLCAYKDARFIFFPRLCLYVHKFVFLWNVFSHILFVCGCAFAENTAVCLGVTSCVTWVLWYHTSLIFSQHPYKLVLPPLTSPYPIPPPTSSIPQASILSPLPGGAERSLGLITPSVLIMHRLQLWLKFRTGFLIPEIPYLSPGCLRSLLNSACFIFSWLSLPPQQITSSGNNTTMYAVVKAKKPWVNP